MTKFLIAAAALAFAAPTMAQSADPHAAHKSAEHEGHQMECCKDKNGNGKPDCCEAAADKAQMKCCDKAERKAGDKHSGH